MSKLVDIETILQAWRDMRLEVWAQSAGNKRYPESDEYSRIFSLNDIDYLIEKIIDTLPEEKPSVKEAMQQLDNKTAIARKLWEGVDADKFMDELRGREPEENPVDLEQEANEFWDDFSIGWDGNSIMTMDHKEFMAFARRFYELGRNAKKD